MIPGVMHRRRFSDLSEQEILALAISSEEDDARLVAEINQANPASAHTAMVFENAEDIRTLKNIGINVATLVGVMLALIVISVVIG